MDTFWQKNGDWFYVIFRIAVGVMFFQHGLQKLFGMLGGNAAAAFSWPMWWVGLFELLGGLAVAIGLFTRLAAALSAILMALAYFVAHRAWLPILNNGELAAMYFFAFLLIMAMGARRWSLERMIFGKEF